VHCLMQYKTSCKKYYSLLVVLVLVSSSSCHYQVDLLYLVPAVLLGTRVGDLLVVQSELLPFLHRAFNCVTCQLNETDGEESFTGITASSYDAKRSMTNRDFANTTYQVLVLITIVDCKNIIFPKDQRNSYQGILQWKRAR